MKAVYEVPEVTTYTEKEILGQLGPAYTDPPDLDQGACAGAGV